MSTNPFDPVAVQKPISELTVRSAIKITQQFPGARLGGSFLVLGAAASDLDIFMDWSTWLEVNKWLEAQEQYVVYKNYKLSDYEHDAGYALLTVADLGQLQFIVVKDEYMPAYKLSAEIMQKDEHLYQNKEDRVALHRILRHLCTTGHLQPKE